MPTSNHNYNDLAHRLEEARRRNSGLCYTHPDDLIKDRGDLWCNYRDTTELEDIISKATIRAEDYLHRKVMEVDKKGQLGRKTECEYNSLMDFHYFIGLLSIWRQDLERCTTDLGLCITQELFDKYKDKYSIDCVVKKLLCSDDARLYSDLYKLFVPKHGYCLDTKRLDWGNELECECDDPIYPDFEARITNVTFNSLTVEWDIFLPTVFVIEVFKILPGETVASALQNPAVFTTTRTSGPVVVTDLEINTRYLVRVSAVNCAGNRQAEVTIQTLPIYLTFEVEGNGTFINIDKPAIPMENEFVVIDDGMYINGALETSDRYRLLADDSDIIDPNTCFNYLAKIELEDETQGLIDITQRMISLSPSVDTILDNTTLTTNFGPQGFPRQFTGEIVQSYMQSYPVFEDTTIRFVFYEYCSEVTQTACLESSGVTNPYPTELVLTIDGEVITIGGEFPTNANLFNALYTVNSGVITQRPLSTIANNLRVIIYNALSLSFGSLSSAINTSYITYITNELISFGTVDIGGWMFDFLDPDICCQLEIPKFGAVGVTSTSTSIGFDVNSTSDEPINILVSEGGVDITGSLSIIISGINPFTVLISGLNSSIQYVIVIEQTNCAGTGTDTIIASTTA